MCFSTFAFCLCTVAFLPVVNSGGAQDPPPPPVRATPTPTPAADSAAHAEDETVRVDTELTEILLTAIDKERRFVTTLRPEDVEVYEDDVRQDVTTFQRETDVPLSLAVLVDTSASQEQVLKDEKEAARAFIDSVLRPEKDSAAVLSFTGVTWINQSLTGDAARLREAVESLKVVYTATNPECNSDNLTDEQILRCRTAVWDALIITVDKVLSQTARTRRAVILLSDGDDTASDAEREEAVDFAVKHDAVLYSIGIRDENFPHGKLRRDDLRKASERTGGRAFFPRTRADLDSAFRQINDELRSQYLVAYRPSNTKHDGAFRRVRVEITNPAFKKEKVRLLYRQGYYAKTL